MIRKLNAILHFYRSFAAAPLAISIVCWYILHELKNEHDLSLISVLIIFKLISSLVLWLLVRSLSSKRIYYYYNLHISASQLWLTAFFIDLTIFIAGIWAIQ